MTAYNLETIFYKHIVKTVIIWASSIKYLLNLIVFFDVKTLKNDKNVPTCLVLVSLHKKIQNFILWKKITRCSCSKSDNDFYTNKINVEYNEEDVK